jgi:hypothetical protein
MVQGRAGHGLGKASAPPGGEIELIQLDSFACSVTRHQHCYAENVMGGMHVDGTGDGLATAQGRLARRPGEAAFELMQLDSFASSATRH